ncbi:sensor histidine kinase [Dactylosporangium sucinum]|uniref:sensor histidine kinase n=1 Tax=Dactylosporangium sucinum TaxID=1424081 RepID=UPI001E473662|nr:sensor histidine kinase [Dactylosporangium sucinum]
MLAGGRAVASGAAHAWLVVAVAGVLALTYAAGVWFARVRVSRQAARVWLAAVVTVWLLLLALSADGVWVAFPLYFLQLHLLPRRAGVVAVLVTAIVAITGFAAHAGNLTLAITVGPILGAAVAIAVVRGYQALYRESERRRQLIEELTATRADLAAAQHTAGMLAERERLAREIHDTLTQGLSSIQLLLRAAERALPDTTQTAARHVAQARQAAIDNLAEARRFVAALTPPALDDAGLVEALEQLCATTSARHRLATRLHRTGEPVPLSSATEFALLRIAQSALSNVVRHANADTVDVTLSYLGDHVALDIVDDGTGFDPTQLAPTEPSNGGFGLATMRARAHALGGTLTIEATSGHGTALAVQVPTGTGTNP